MRRPTPLRILLAAALAAATTVTGTLTGAAAHATTTFHWGVATSGFQSEGYAPDSNWSRYVARDAGSSKDPYGNAVDFRHRYAEDIGLAEAVGVNTFRFGVEWARVEPRRGVWDQTELAYYDDVVRRIKDAGMTPMITLNHFVHPGWVVDQGGWNNAQTVTDWLAFAQTIVMRYEGQGVMWVTINEPTVYIALEMSNQPGTDAVAMRAHLIDAHRRAYDMIHRVDPGAMVTSNIAFIPGVPGVMDALFIDQVTDKLDFVGIDYYYGVSLDNLTAFYSATGEPWKVKPQPDGIYYALRYYRDKFPGLPLYIVENGMPTDNGAARPDGYSRADDLRDTVYWIQRARADGANVIGYNYWSITDNYEWGSYEPRFGLYTVDVLTDPTLTRKPTDGVAAFQQVIQNGGVPSGYRPVMPPALCSLVIPLSSCLDPADPPRL